MTMFTRVHQENRRSSPTLRFLLRKSPYLNVKIFSLIFPQTVNYPTEYRERDEILIKDPSTLRIFLDHLYQSGAILGMRLANLKCKVLIQDWPGSRSNAIPAEEELGEVG